MKDVILSSVWNEGVNMKDILFRAKAINRKEGFEYRTNYKNGDWVYGLITKKFDDKFPILPVEMTNEDGVSGIDVDYKTIGQYTGLTDKNGTKIFEGDIVRVFDEKYTNHAVFYDEKYCAFVIGNVPFSYYVHDIEVVGNIYDNPELLKGSAKNE